MFRSHLKEVAYRPYPPMDQFIGFVSELAYSTYNRLVKPKNDPCFSLEDVQQVVLISLASELGGAEFVNADRLRLRTVAEDAVKGMLANGGWRPRTARSLNESITNKDGGSCERIELLSASGQEADAEEDIALNDEASDLLGQVKRTPYGPKMVAIGNKVLEEQPLSDAERQTRRQFKNCFHDLTRAIERFCTVPQKPHRKRRAKELQPSTA